MARKDFVDHLIAIGYKVEVRGENCLAFRYTIAIGRFAGDNQALAIFGMPQGDGGRLNGQFRNGTLRRGKRAQGE